MFVNSHNYSNRDSIDMYAKKVCGGDTMDLVWSEFA